MIVLIFACNSKIKEFHESKYTTIEFNELKSKIDSITLYELNGDQSFDLSNLKKLEVLKPNGFNVFKIRSDTFINLFKLKKKLDFIIAYHDDFSRTHDLPNFRRVTLQPKETDTIISIKIPCYFEVSCKELMNHNYDSVNFTLMSYKKFTHELVTTESTLFRNDNTNQYKVLEFIIPDHYVVFDFKCYHLGKVKSIKQTFEYNPSNRLIRYSPNLYNSHYNIEN